MIDWGPGPAFLIFLEGGVDLAVLDVVAGISGDEALANLSAFGPSRYKIASPNRKLYVPFEHL